MDRSKREAQNQLEAIKQSILDGRLTHGQICDALAEEIKKELQKSAEEVDIEYVLACQRLIASLHPKKAAQAESHAEHNFQAAHAKLQQEKHSVQKGRKRAIRYGFAVAFLLVVLAGADILLTKRQINVSYSPDHEQIVYDGMMTMPGILEMAGADIQGDAVQELTTKNWDEVVAFLGYVPGMLHGFRTDGCWMNTIALYSKTFRYSTSPILVRDSMNISHIPSNIIMAANRYMVLLSKMELAMKRSQRQGSAFISQAIQAAASSFGITDPMSTA